MFALIGITAAYNGGDGRPGCQNEFEYQRLWRNNWDPTRYWMCENGEAIPYGCAMDHFFYESRQDCVPRSEWRWTEPYDPPTRT